MVGLNLRISQVIEKQEERTKGFKSAYKGEVIMMALTLNWEEMEVRV